MELQEFVESTLRQIGQACNNASTEGAKINRRYYIEADRPIEFDVAMTVEDAAKQGGGGKLRVASLVFGAEAGAVKESTITRSEISRVRFKVTEAWND